jgi:hypothetical protein
MSWKATKVCVVAGNPDPRRDGVDILYDPDTNPDAENWHVLVYVPPGVDTRATGWVLAEGWLYPRSSADEEADEIVRLHGCERVVPVIKPGTRFTFAQATRLLPIDITEASNREVTRAEDL